MVKLFVLSMSVIFVMLVNGCAPAAPSSEMIQTAIAETQSIEPSSTTIPTIEPTQTFTIQPTFTVTPTPDIRIYIESPENLLPKVSDLPVSGGYYIPQGGLTVNTNQEVINARGVEEGKEYIDKSGRVTGYYVWFFRGNATQRLPEEISHFVGQYKTSEGAIIALDDFNSVGKTTQNGYTEEPIKIYFTIGDKSAMFKEINKNNGIVISHLVFTYKNYFIDITGCCSEKDVKPEDLKNLGEKTLNKIQGLELYDPGELPENSLFATQ